MTQPAQSLLRLNADTDKADQNLMSVRSSSGLDDVIQNLIIHLIHSDAA